ncbi:YdeI/OmpD-associated family protein [Candidatus Kaiserbacteria bacterium]|nr:YdeI/OmpD-associated family protein [Candidatus Kaiserbacteria bacterium]
MSASKINKDFLHRVPADLRAALNKNKDVEEYWEKLTPLARNEWICWVTIVKKPETRAEHLKRLCEDLRKGKKRPCCWPGCPHRRESAKKYFKDTK